MSTDAFHVDCPYGHVTRGGRPARVICSDRKGDYPILAVVGEDEETVRAYHADGRAASKDAELSINDLVDKLKPLKVEQKYLIWFHGFGQASITFNSYTDAVRCVAGTNDSSEGYPTDIVNCLLHATLYDDTPMIVELMDLREFVREVEMEARNLLDRKEV